MILAGGDDYEVLLTAPPGRAAALDAASLAAGIPLTRIGVIAAGPGTAILVDAAGAPVVLERAGWRHF
jgi:thiamine-monophosphate kinase